MDRDLVALAREGDHDAFSAIAAASIGRLFALARGILSDSERAEDAVQDTLLLAWRDIRGLRDLDRLDAWLYRLLVRSCYRQAGRDRRRTVIEKHLDADGGRQTQPIDRAVVERDRIERGFRRVPPEQRAVLVLHHQIGLELGEIAEILDIPLGTAKSRLFRGVRAIRSAIEADDQDTVLARGQPA